MTDTERLQEAALIIADWKHRLLQQSSGNFIMRAEIYYDGALLKRAISIPDRTNTGVSTHIADLKASLADCRALLAKSEASLAYCRNQSEKNKTKRVEMLRHIAGHENTNRKLAGQLRGLKTMARTIERLSQERNALLADKSADRALMHTRHLCKRIIGQRREINRLLILEKLYWKFVNEWRDDAREFERKIATLKAEKATAYASGVRDGMSCARAKSTAECDGKTLTVPEPSAQEKGLI